MVQGYILGNNAKGISSNWLDIPKLPWEEESEKELLVDILDKLIGVNEKSLWPSVVVFVLGHSIGISLEGKLSNLLTCASQSLWYIIDFISWLSCQEVSEMLECYGVLL